MAVAAVASVIDHIRLQMLVNFEQSLFIEEQRPQVILQVEGSLAALCLVLLEFFPAPLHHLSILLGGTGGVPVLHGGAVPCKGEDVRLVFHRHIHQRRDLGHIPLGHRGHDGHMDACPTQHGDDCQCLVVGAGAADAVVSLPQAVQGELVFPTAAALEPLADLISEMEGVAQDGKGQIPLLQQFCQLPELGMQDGVCRR